MIKILVFFVILALVILLINHFSIAKENNLGLYMIFSGISLIVNIPIGAEDIILALYAKFAGVFVPLENESPLPIIISGFLLILFGFYYLRVISKRTYVLNLLGKSLKEINEDKTIRELKLSSYQIQERLVDLEHTFNDDIKTIESLNSHTVNSIKRNSQIISERSRNQMLLLTGMAPIPYTIIAGTFLSSKNEIGYLEYNRTTNKYYSIKPSKKRFPQLIKKEVRNENSKIEDIAVALSITAKIQEADLEQFCSFPLVHFYLEEPQDNVIFCFSQLEDYCGTVIKYIRETNRYIKRVHLIAAIPSCVSYRLGMLIELNGRRVPTIISYHYCRSATPKYPFGIVVNGVKKGDIVRGNMFSYV